jgi:CheY-like chemotaxis protein
VKSVDNDAALLSKGTVAYGFTWEPQVVRALRRPHVEAESPGISVALPTSDMGKRSPSAQRVLLVSADKELHRQVQTCGQKAGLRAKSLVIVKSGSECIAVLEKLRPWLVVLDDQLSDLEGLDLLRHLHRSVPEAYVIFLASRHTAELECTVRQTGVLYYTEKPPDPLLLSRVLSTGLAAASATAKGVASLGA